MDIVIRMKIINAFKANPGLWDKSCEEYRKIQKRPVLKGNLWIQVARSLAESGLKVNMDGLKKAWSHMRIQFMNYCDPSQIHERNKNLDYELLVHEKLFVLSGMIGVEESDGASIGPKRSADKAIKSENQETIDVKTPVLDEILSPKESVVSDSQKKCFDIATLLGSQPTVSTASEEKTKNPPLVQRHRTSPWNYPLLSEDHHTSTGSKMMPPPIPRRKTSTSDSAETFQIDSPWNSEDTEDMRIMRSRSSRDVPRSFPSKPVYQRRRQYTPRNDYTMISMETSNFGLLEVVPVVATSAIAPPSIPTRSSLFPSNTATKRKNTSDNSEIPPKRSAPFSILRENSPPSEAIVPMSESELPSMKITFSSEDNSKVERKVEIKGQNDNNSTKCDSVAETSPFSQFINLPIVRDYMNLYISSQYSNPPVPFDPAHFLASLRMMMMGTQHDTVLQPQNPMLGSGTFYDPVVTQQIPPSLPK